MGEHPKLQKAAVRAKNFDEVSFGYTKEQMYSEAKRCLQCKKPLCVQGCPVNIDIPAFIKLLTLDDIRGALAKIKEKNNLPGVCGRVCPQEEQCEMACILNKKGAAVKIGYLERYAADYGQDEFKIQNSKFKMPEPDESSSRSTVNGPLTSATLPMSPSSTASGLQPTASRVAVIGAGPAGLTCAADLAMLGYSVTLFESLHLPGGVMSYGIPEFRLPKRIVNEEVENIKSLGVDLRLNVVVGNTVTIQDLFDQGYKAMFIGAGAGLPKFMGVEGENLNGVYSANEFLTRVNLMKAYKFPQYATPVIAGKKVAVIGGGNVAMDSARSALRLGAEKVMIVYRRSKNEMPARIEESDNAAEEGIEFEILTAPLRLNSDGKGNVANMECIKMELGDPDESGRRSFKPVKGSEFILDCDAVIVAIGQSPNPLLTNSEMRLQKQKWGGIVADEATGQTSIPGVFAGGDIVTGAATVILAMGAGKKAACAIDTYLQSL